jgi:nicotinamide-nucleotide adenylyltransferase
MSYYERYIIIKTALLEHDFRIQEFSIVPLPVNFPDLYKYYVPLDATFFLTIYDEWGEKKLSMFESMGLKTKILWRRPLSEKGLSSTQIRQYIVSEQPWEHLVPDASARIMKKMDIAERLKNLIK